MSTPAPAPAPTPAPTPAPAPIPAPAPASLPDGWQPKPEQWPPATGSWEYDPALNAVRAVPGTRLPDRDAAPTEE